MSGEPIKLSNPKFVLVVSQHEDDLAYVREGDGTKSSQDVAVIIFKKPLHTEEGMDLMLQLSTMFRNGLEAPEKPKQRWGISYRDTPYGTDRWLIAEFENPLSAFYTFNSEEEARAFIKKKRDSNEYLPIWAIPAPLP